MKRSVLCYLTIMTGIVFADVERGETLYKTYCASCHGEKGAGLVGPNLTDKEILHGTEKADIIRTISKGIPGKGMPAWESILDQAQTADLADFVKSIMGKNLPSPFKKGFSTVTPFPQGSLTRPYLMRTFMPKNGLGDEVFGNHSEGRETRRYKPARGSFHPTVMDQPIAGIPGAIAVTFGSKLSYCFDSTECRLLYTWSGGFMDMTNYWGKGSGGSRKRFGYIGKILGTTGYIARGKAPIEGKPQFKGYRKVQSIPEFMYSLGDVYFTLRIVPGEEDGVAVCHYTVKGFKGNLVMKFDPAVAAQMSVDKGAFKEGQLVLDSTTAASFKITIKPKE